MILAVDIGNTSTKFGLFEGETLTSKFSIPTIRDATVGDLKEAVDGRLDVQIEAAWVCSVVPPVNETLSEFLSNTTWVDPVFIDSSIDFGMKINYRPRESLGTDRLVAAHAAVRKYGAPIIVCSLGTATTVDVVDADREFIGGMIGPGMDVLAEALHLKAPRLPEIVTDKPDKLLGNTTDESIRSGIYHGYVSLVEGVITRIRTETGVVQAVATGGNAARLAEEFAGVMTVDPDLLLDGLRMLSQR